MSNYIPHHTKKLQVRARKEAALRRLIREGAPFDKLTAAADDVRDARIRVIRAQRATIGLRAENQGQFDKLDVEIRALGETPITVILTEFGHTTDADID